MAGQSSVHVRKATLSFVKALVIQNLLPIDDPVVFKVYSEGCRDSLLSVRQEAIHTMSCLVFEYCQINEQVFSFFRLIFLLLLTQNKNMSGHESPIEQGRKKRRQKEEPMDKLGCSPLKIQEYFFESPDREHPRKS